MVKVWDTNTLVVVLAFDFKDKVCPVIVAMEAPWFGVYVLNWDAETVVNWVRKVTADAGLRAELGVGIESSESMRYVSIPRGPTDAPVASNADDPTDAHDYSRLQSVLWSVCFYCRRQYGNCANLP